MFLLLRVGAVQVQDLQNASLEIAVQCSQGQWEII